mgnify:CR=1 FL=1
MKLCRAKLKQMNMEIYNKFFNISMEALRTWGDSNSLVKREFRLSGCFFNSFNLLGIIAKMASSPPDTMDTRIKKNKVNNNKPIPFPCKVVNFTREFISKRHKNGSIVSKVAVKLLFRI